MSREAILNRLCYLYPDSRLGEVRARANRSSGNLGTASTSGTEPDGVASLDLGPPSSTQGPQA